MTSAHSPTEAAKFAPPNLDRAIPRPALIERLRAASPTARWINAPSGAGKSTLVACHVSTRRAPLLWYRLDERDADSAFFFATLAAQLSARLGTPGSLPAFADSDRAQETGFAKRFFRALGSVGDPLLVVLDDLQQVDNTAVIDWLAHWLALRHPETELILLSQRPPPPGLYGALAAGQLAALGDLGLPFGVAECAQIAARHGLAPARGAELAEITGGHAAALVLACELMRSEGTRSTASLPRVEQVHRHLVGKLLAQLPFDAERVLLAGHALPCLTVSWVRTLLPDVDAAAQLALLVERGLLTRAADGDGGSYLMHALVRQAARSVVNERLGHNATGDHLRTCARLLAAAERHDEALALLRSLDATDAALDVLQALAEHCARTRQSTRLQRAIDAWPAVPLERRPWLLFWLGHSLLAVDDGRARQAFMQAYAGFAQSGEQTGQALAAASVMVVFNLLSNDQPQRDDWLAHFRAVRTAHALGDSLPWRGLYLLGLVCEANLADAPTLDGPLVDQALEALVDIARTPASWPVPGTPLLAATLAVDYVFTVDSYQRTFHLVRSFAQLAVDPQMPALLRAEWWHMITMIQTSAGDWEAAREALRRQSELVEAHGLSALRSQLGRQSVDLALRTGDVAAAADELAELEARLVDPTPGDLALLARLNTRVLMRQGRLSDALASARTALDAAHRAGQQGSHSVPYELDLAQALAAQGLSTEAAGRLSALAAMLDKTQRLCILATRDTMLALASTPPDLDLLRSGFAQARQAEFHGLLGGLPQLAAQAAAVAFAHGIASDFAHAMVDRQRLVAPATADSRWPWPVRVHAVGALRIELDGAPYRPERKAQDRPLDLLKLLACAEARERPAVDKSWAAAQLYPDTDHTNARKALDMVIARLRKLLGGEDRIQVADGKVQLAPQLVWLDVRDLVQALHQAQHSRDVLARSAHGADLHTSLLRLIELYRGALLEGSDPTPWVLAARTRLTQRVRIALVSLTDALPPSDTAVLALERALLVDPLAEDLARALMRAYLERNAPGEALRVYRRCRDMLSIEIGAIPGSALEALRQRVDTLTQATAKTPGGAAIGTSATGAASTC
jgi:ATP/maltotriose-dependent transcriptional regulator MalT/DNA-binding SARP family transcriptional activator